MRYAHDHLWRQIRDRRQLLGLTLEQVSKRTGLAIAYLSLLERGGIENPGIWTMQKLAIGLGWSIDELIGEVRTKHLDNELEEDLASYQVLRADVVSVIQNLKEAVSKHERRLALARNARRNRKLGPGDDPEGI